MVRENRLQRHQNRFDRHWDPAPSRQRPGDPCVSTVVNHHPVVVDHWESGGRGQRRESGPGLPVHGSILTGTCSYPLCMATDPGSLIDERKLNRAEFRFGIANLFSRESGSEDEIL